MYLSLIKPTENKTFSIYDPLGIKLLKGRGKCIQHRNFCMLDEMLDAFDRRQILRKMKKEEKNRVG